MGSNINTKAGGNVLMVISTEYFLYTQAYEKGMAPEYEVLYSDIK